jgi:tetratricopeptide (TPR) repeat protein
LKNEGNKYFKEGNYLDAYDFYTDAIEACPGMTGTEIMELKLKHDEQEREKTYRRNSREAERLRKRDDTSIKPSKSNNEDVNTHQEGDDEDINDKPCEFKIPPHEYGDKLSVYYCNRAACSINLERYQEAISDCDLSLILNPTYTKAFIRRMTAYEKTEQVDKALVDAKAAQQLDSKNVDIKRHVQRLQKLEDARMEKLKAETMGKLKELGNSILGNFGMSLDNFKAVQDPNTGSYSISYQNN